MGQAPAFLDFLERLSQVAKVERPVLLVGERGSGKELAAGRLHFLSSRWQGPLVALNCAALAPSLLESELFGHESGAFTGATRRRPGRFETAQGGTLFLDEIGLIPIEVQEKILRAVEYRTFERVGGSEPIRVDVRIIGATNANLPELVRLGKFKRDLLDRLSFEVLFLPPLRSRPEDILLLARHFTTRMALELDREEAPDFSAEALRQLQQYPWPGNVRELKNVVERAVYRCQGPLIDRIVFDPFLSPYAPLAEESAPVINSAPPSAITKPGSTDVGPGPTNATDCPEGEALASPSELGAQLYRRARQEGLDWEQAWQRCELAALQTALQESRWRQAEAARLLGLSYHQFRGLYRKYQAELDKGISDPAP